MEFRNIFSFTNESKEMRFGIKIIMDAFRIAMIPLKRLQAGFWRWLFEFFRMLNLVKGAFPVQSMQLLSVYEFPELAAI